MHLSVRPLPPLVGIPASGSRRRNVVVIAIATSCFIGVLVLKVRDIRAWFLVFRYSLALWSFVRISAA